MTSALDHAWQKEQSRLRPTLLTPEAISWSDGPDPDLFWVPEDLTPLWGTASYNQFNESQKLSYNQFYGQQLAEEFFWIETSLICAPLKALCTSGNEASARGAVLESFFRDEQNHVASFEKLVACAVKVNGQDSQFFNPPATVRHMARIIAAAPKVLAYWVTAVEAFETYAVTIGQRYQNDQALDPLFRDIFTRHARDEARHCQYDALLTDWLVEGRSGWLTSVNSYLSEVFVSRYYKNDWGLDGPIRALVKAYPEIAAVEHEMSQDAITARDESGAMVIQTH